MTIRTTSDRKRGLQLNSRQFNGTVNERPHTGQKQRLKAAKRLAEQKEKSNGKD